MRKLTASLFMSIDGVVESPNLWQFDRFDDELGASMNAMMRTVDTAILGRRGYQDWSKYWPQASESDLFAAFINPVQKFVASHTLSGELIWQNANLIDGDVLEFLAELKKGEGGEISVFSSISLVRQLLFAEILDELTLMIHPVIAGAGRHLFEADDETTQLELLKSITTTKGNVIVTYKLRTP